MTAQAVQFYLGNKVLRFGKFTLKSGRESPFFFNLGAIATSKAIRELGVMYASTLLASGIEFDALFGPAYKGIPLMTATATVLADPHFLGPNARDVSCAYNRKEAKDHGEGGTLVGANLSGKRVVLIDDVLTAGTALREAIVLLQNAGAKPVAAVIALDRQERGSGPRSAVSELEEASGIQVIPIATLADVVNYLMTSHEHRDELDAIKKYIAEYGAR